ncbi:hypothetical protein BS47DRAFT_926171 [Hydnum rufescens UP504]|uniref:Uncharacterized protein n=1 Tax=Hydnum rufescens UP504 TaxID=1448309 RepID=A0A9P6B9H5_9AGAM|nr:hypothetical protein BS47DRAFT_926171 [Hydnum rufescens UP504]
MFSSWSLGPLGGRSIAIHPNAFAYIAKAEPPFSWPVAYFYKEVTSPESWLDSFKSGDVQDIVCYKDRVHEYLLMFVRIPNQGIPPVWVRTERHPMKSGIAKMFSRSLDALDTIKFSYDRSKLWNPEDDNIMASAFADLNFRHVIDLLNTIHELTNIRGITGLNHTWYARIVIGTLQGGFGRVWLNPPQRDWVIALNLFGRDTTQATQSVEHRFAIEQPSMNTLSLMQQDEWKNETLARILSTQLSPDDHGPTLPRAPEHAPQSQASGSHSPTEIPFSPIGVRFDSDCTPSASIVQPPLYDANISLTSGLMPTTFTTGRTCVPPNVAPINSSSEPSWMWDAIPSVCRPGCASQDIHRRRIFDKFIPSIAKADEVPQGAFVGDTRQGQQGKPPIHSTPNPNRGPRPTVNVFPSSELATEQASPSFTNAQPPPEPPNLTGRILRLGSTPIAMGGYSSVWRGRLFSATSGNPDRSLQVAIKMLRASHTDEYTLKRKLHKKCEYGPYCATRTWWDC